MIKARYDNDGNIILESSSDRAPLDFSPVTVEPEVILVETREAAWTLIPEPDISAVPAPAVVEVSETRKRVFTVPKSISNTLAEGGRQFGETSKSAALAMDQISEDFRSVPARVRGGLRSFWKIASSPVSLPGSRRTSPPTKLGLFVTDTIRFGGTFALIFGALFLSVNYQSFFQIARAQLALGSDIKTEEALQNMNATGIRDVGLSGVITQKSEANILKYLPAVGPYEDRLIIPKIGKNVPIVRPSMDALVKEDWKTFEDDIQSALHDGVVHYPGSARPGQAGNFFVTGHSSYYPWDDGKYKDVFARLHELDIGDTYFVYYGGDKHTYRITQKYEVKPSDVTVLDQPLDKRTATLMTCTPVGTTLRRLIVQAEEIDPATGDVLKVGQKADETSGKPFTRLEALPI